MHLAFAILSPRQYISHIAIIIVLRLICVNSGPHIYFPTLIQKGQEKKKQTSLAVGHFVDGVKPLKSSGQRFTKDDIVRVKSLRMLCCGDGTVGIYQLDLTFGTYTSFIEKK